MSDRDDKGRFQKGHTSWCAGTKGLIPSHTAWNKGIKLPYEVWNKGKKGLQVAWNKGKKVPQMTGKNHPNFGKHFLWTEEQKAKLRPLRQKERHPNWIADRNLLVKSEHKHLDGKYRDWMLAVKKRDGWKCKMDNSDCNGRLESHHILSWKYYPELRYELNNGITLCHAHHPLGKEQEAKWATFFQELVSKVR